jgi:tetratricopeptide (TPR) repeat protein
MKQISFLKLFLVFNFLAFSFLNFIFLTFYTFNFAEAEQDTVKETVKRTIQPSIIVNLSKAQIEQIKADAQNTKKEWKVRNSKFVSEATLKRHLRAEQYMASKKYKDVYPLLNRVIQRGSSTKYEIAKTKTLMARSYLAEEKLKEAEVLLQEALDSDQLSYQESCESLLQLAQVQMMAKNYLEAKKNIISYIEISSANPVSQVILAAINFQIDDFDGAKRAIDAALKLTKSPQEPWLYLAANIHFKTKNYQTAEDHFRKLLDMRQTNKNYWMGLVGVLFEQNKTLEAMSIYELANKLGYITEESEILSRAGLMQASEIPYKAGTELANAIKEKKVPESKSTYESLATYWFASKEFDKAVAAYEKASEFSKDGKVDLMLGQVFLEMENWSKASKAFSLAIKKGNLKVQEGSAYLGLGLASFFNNDKVAAVKYFSKAKNFKSQKQTAEKWMSHLN